MRALETFAIYVTPFLVLGAITRYLLSWNHGGVERSLVYRKLCGVGYDVVDFSF
jgi:hypothetical protein